MEFLVDVDIRLPSDCDPAERERLLEEEFHYGAARRRGGELVRIWRVPGRTANVAIWRADDATALHSLLAGLPLFDHMNIRVQALARHPLESADELSDIYERRR